MRAWLVSAALTALLAVGHAFAATPDATVSSAQQAMQQGNWPQAITEWQHLYVKGEPQAEAQLCALYFDSRQGTFDASHVTDWCRRAAGDGDAGALFRMGLLYLVGLGVDRDPAQAQALCATAASRAPSQVPAGFCLAAAARDSETAAREMLQLPKPPSPPVASVVDPAAAPQQGCDHAFKADSFDAVAAVRWCERAAAAGDREAQARLGLMKLMGVGEPRDLAAAEADCDRAGGGTGASPAAAFCLAAAAHLRRSATAAAVSRRTGAIDADPTTGRTLPKTTVDPFALDGVLDEHRTTATGLFYTCRMLAQWGLYEGKGLSVIRPDELVFGRRLADYRPADFAALDQAAVNCAKAAEPLVGAPVSLDPKDSLLHNLAAFRRSLGALEERRTALQTEQRLSRQDAGLIAAVAQDARAGGIVLPYDVTAQEHVCIDRVSQVWRASAQNDGRRMLEIRDTRLDTEDGRFVARGIANVVDANSIVHAVIAASSFACTFDRATGVRIASFQLLPGFAPMR